MDLSRSGAIYALVGTVDPRTQEIGAYILRFHELDQNHQVFPLSRSVAAYKLRLDAQDNLYLLGLDETGFAEIERNWGSAVHTLLHKFSAQGTYLGSFLPLAIDASWSDRHRSNYASPVNHPGNFEVDPEGNA